ncbi:putative tyrosinase-like protein tyr-3 [Dreissena polymorpha]|nr:putative tyrosinase-like protein tyr-3 [Dreissena polymorpha]
MSPEIADCINRLTPLVNTTDQKRVPGFGTPEDVHLYCLQQFVWRSGMVRWGDYNISKTDMDFVNGLLASNGQYDKLANLHRGAATMSAHFGPNFLGWHRVYLALMEEAIRKINKKLSLPYWDSTLDFDMENPANTIMFAPEFLGDGYGLVTTGPFANWATPIGKLERNIGGDSELFSKEIIKSIMKRCKTSEIVAPTAESDSDIELYHGGPHVWVGGHMTGLNTAAHDPVFFLHHAFVDYIWEMFRTRQSSVCKVNPELDYPKASGEHASNRAMDGLSGYVNIDGYRNYWTKSWYKYEPSPTCPSCGSPYLKCNKARGVCVSIERKLTPEEGSLVRGNLAFDAAETATSARAASARDQVKQLDVGPTFRAPPAEPRTQKAQLARMR